MKNKNMKRTVITTALALTLTAGLSVPAGAANRWSCPEELKNCQVQVSTICTNGWLQDLLNCLKPNCPETPVEPETPEVPEKPETPETPDAPVVPEAPETPVVPETPEEDNTVTDSVHAYEKAVVDLVNEQRAQRGLAPLTLSAELCAGARVKSQDMADNNYFSHTSPTYGSPFDMMKQFGITYNTAGENIAQGYATPEAVVTAWMNSQGHRENILSAKYTTLGVGYVADGNYWTQWFIG